MADTGIDLRSSGGELWVVYALVDLGSYMIDGSRIFPRPTYIVHSGRGLHLCYIFERPLDVCPNVCEVLGELKGALMPMIWNEGASGEAHSQMARAFGVSRPTVIKWLKEENG